ncbi:MAG: Tellurite resistance protein TerB [Cyanobacteria bacterium M_surface_10_m2_119]|jgi:tellurite resistance protein|nr:Tellurite resistance protein TerB [Cyanobacteria bacterium M_surface_10_m2_119]
MVISNGPAPAAAPESCTEARQHPDGFSADQAFLAVALAAVSWDGVLSPAGTRALRHAIDYRQPFCTFSDQELVQGIDDLLQRLRLQGAQQLMLKAARVLSPQLRRTAFATAAEIMRSDGPLQPDERNILSTLADTLELSTADTQAMLGLMEVLHAPVV